MRLERARHITDWRAADLSAETRLGIDYSEINRKPVRMTSSSTLAKFLVSEITIRDF